MTSRGNRILIPVLVVAFVNFAAFFIVALCIGGDAVNGRVENGSYYLSHHGTLTEVDRAVYVYSYVHAVSVWVTHAAVFVALYFSRAARDKEVGPR